MKIINSIIIAFLIAGCAANLPKKEKLKEEFDPLSLNDDDIIEQFKKQSEAFGMESNIPPKVLPDSTRGTRYVRGYRVQIFSSPQKKEAMKVLEEARGIFQEKVYFSFETPYYKIRLGNFQRVSEAEKLLRKAQAEGFKTSFLVRTIVNLGQE